MYDDNKRWCGIELIMEDSPIKNFLIGRPDMPGVHSLTELLEGKNFSICGGGISTWKISVENRQYTLYVYVCVAGHDLTFTILLPNEFKECIKQWRDKLISYKRRIDKRTTVMERYNNL